MSVDATIKSREEKEGKKGGIKTHDGFDMSSVSSCSTALAIFHCNTFVRRLTQDLHGMDIDRWIRLARRLWETCRCGKHMIGIEEAVLVDFLD
jgi:hypothetical protein